VKSTLRLLLPLAAVFFGPSTQSLASLGKRPAEDFDVPLVHVALDAGVSTDSWIRHYDVYVSRIPPSSTDSSHLPLYFFPRGARFEKKIGRTDYLVFAGVLGDSEKPFCPSQASIDSGGPFVIFLDFIHADLSGESLDHPLIRNDTYSQPNQSSEPTPASVTPPAGQESRPR
jgi:hypothetical protein